MEQKILQFTVSGQELTYVGDLVCEASDTVNYNRAEFEFLDDGWHVVDSTGKILGDYYKGEFTPVTE